MAHNVRPRPYAPSPPRHRLVAWGVSILLTLGALTASALPAQAATRASDSLPVAQAKVALPAIAKTGQVRAASKAKKPNDFAGVAVLPLIIGAAAVVAVVVVATTNGSSSG